MSITSSHIIGTAAVKAALQTLRGVVTSSRHQLQPLRAKLIEGTIMKILKEWVLAFMICRMLAGQLPNSIEAVHMCTLIVDTPEMLMLLWESNLCGDGLPADLQAATWRSCEYSFCFLTIILSHQCLAVTPDIFNYLDSAIFQPAQRAVQEWFDSFLRYALFYTLHHLLPNPRLFPDYIDSWPMDTDLKMRTLVLAKTGAYIHLYSRNSESEDIQSFNMLLDAYQHVSGISHFSKGFTNQ
jgi:hypothetical protein